MGFLPFHHLIDLLGSGNSSAISFVLMRRVRNWVQTGFEGAVGNFLGMQLQIDPAVDAHRHDLLHIAGRGPKVRRLSACRARSVRYRAAVDALPCSLGVSQHLRDRARQAEAEKTNSELRAAQTHVDSQTGQRRRALANYQPGPKEKVAVGGYQRQ